ncbi:MAG: alkaline phosphatase family protein [Gemmatimonadales bacterium]
MRRPFSLFILVLAAAITVAPPLHTEARAPGAVARHVILISFDGMRADALQRVWPASLQAQGAASWSARTTLPSSTLPSHASMVTGVGPEIHNVRFNNWDTDQPRLALPTIFTEVRRAGGSVRVIVTKPKLRFLAAPELVIYHNYPRRRQGEVVAIVGQTFRAERPTLLFVHVADPDAVGHRAGWMSEPYLAVIAEVPSLVAGLLRDVVAAGVLNETLLIVTADHGGHSRTHGTDLPEDMMIPWVALGGAARPGLTLTQPIVTYDTAATVLYALGVPIPAGWVGRSITGALRAVVPQR